MAFGTILAITFLTLEGNRLIETAAEKKIPPEN